MKKFFTLIAAFVVALSVSAQDEEIDNTFQFIDEAGTVVPHGTTLYRNQVEEFIDSWCVYPGLKVQCADDSWNSKNVKLSINIKEITTGGISTCFGGQCFPAKREVGSFTTMAGLMLANPDDLQTEWLLDGKDIYGKAVVEFQIISNGGFYDVNGPMITVVFENNDPTGINDAQADSNKTVVARYTLDGQQIAAPQKGINILKMSDGTTKKVVVKE